MEYDKKVCSQPIVQPKPSSKTASVTEDGTGVFSCHEKSAKRSPAKAASFIFSGFNLGE